MEKTIIINIGNTIIHIEESAYELLKAYLNEVKHHFANNADDLEIVTDIENRIAELLTEQLDEQKKQVVDSRNVNLVIAQMGRVQDFDFQEENEEQPVYQASYQFHAEKKLYRDMDERVIAGVCAGIAHYVDIDVKWIRLASALTVSLGGSGLLVYALLWVIMPKAKSRVEKMEMKGEPANLQGFQKNLDEELQAVKERLTEANRHAQPLIARFGIFIGEFFEWLGKFISGTGKIIFKVIAGAIIAFGSFFMLALIVTLAAFLGFFDSSVYDFFPLSIVSQSYRSVLLFWSFIVLFVPVLALVLFSIRVAFNRQAINKVLSFALLIIWLAGVAGTGYYVAKISSEFQDHAELSHTDSLHPFPTYTIDIDNTKFFSKEDSLAYKIDDEFKDRVVVENFDDHPFRMPSTAYIHIEKSDGEDASITQTYESQGKTFQIALQNAKNISYSYEKHNDLLLFSPRFHLKSGSTWRKQCVWVTLKVPIGTHLILKKDAYRYIQNDYGWGCKANDNEPEGDNKEWVMTADGLKCKYDIDHPEENK